jgi:stress response protein YsnF
VQSLFVGAAWIARGGAQVSYPGPEGERHKVVRSPYCPHGTARLEEGALETDGLFQDRTIEVSELGEVPLISRKPVVREELVIRRAAEEHTEVIRGTVRRTVADVTDLNSKADDEQRPISDRA